MTIHFIVAALLLAAFLFHLWVFFKAGQEMEKERRRSQEKQ